VQPVRELDQQDPDVAGHRDDHLADVLGLLVLAAAERQRVELGEAVHDARDLAAELVVELRDAHVGVLDGVVQERRLRVVVSRPRSARIWATASGCSMKSSPDRRFCPSWCSARTGRRARSPSGPPWRCSP
jgi:hypothetical protein